MSMSCFTMSRWPQNAATCSGDTPLPLRGKPMAAISDYTTDPLPRLPTGIDTTYIAVIRIDELTQLYAVPQQAITESQWATLGLADGVYLSAYLPDDEVPVGVLGDDRTAVARGERAGAAVRLVSWLGSPWSRWSRRKRALLASMWVGHPGLPNATSVSVGAVLRSAMRCRVALRLGRRVGRWLGWWVWSMVGWVRGRGVCRRVV
jgi:hypothetical protein